ncbi:MAG TPA: ribosome maturation factor RimP [Anaeromyxobacteraceae bacterium]|nr:ribosome maturation factor RimP [Anaeromyxobacteraceae bacterium]
MTAIGTEPIADRASRLLEPIIAREGFELVEVEWVREGPSWVLRLFVDRPGGVSVDACQELSLVIGPVLDVEDFIEAAYNLEVSSPGLDRPLTKPAHFERYAGQRARIRTSRPIETASGSRRNFCGTLRGFREGAVEVEEDGLVHRIPREQIARARLEYDFDADLRRKG